MATPDTLETRIGTLTSVDGVPDEKTTQAVYANLDFQRAVQAYLNSIQTASMSAMRNGIHRMDFEMFEEINEVVQAEPAKCLVPRPRARRSDGDDALLPTLGRTG